MADPGFGEIVCVFGPSGVDLEGIDTLPRWNENKHKFAPRCTF